MGLLNGVQGGLARAVGTIVAGYLYQNYGARAMWLVTDMAVPLSLLGVAAFAFFKSRGEAQQSGETRSLLQKVEK